MSILNQINYPQDLKCLTKEQLLLLCQELRDFIIDSVSKTGGHFAANLGVVELSVALHYVFDAPNDKIIWDVGHQSYPHKILTGRKQSFDNLRKFKGISGFPKMEESPYDAFGTGHSSTSISAVMGMAMAAKLSGEQRNHIAVIGDGALSAGQAFEALNNLGFLKLPVLVILNDNHMGIDPVSGALNDYLNGLKEGEPNLFTRLGIHYTGPIDGHDLDALLIALNSYKNYHGPVVLHVKTLKGKGFKPAENEQTRWHSTSGFDKINPNDSLQVNTTKFQDLFGQKLLQLAEKDPKIVAITPAMVSGSSLHFMQQRFPERVFDVGIAEQHAVTFAAGLAAAGFKPFCFLYATFMQRAMDQIIHDVCLQKLPIVFCIDRAGAVGEDGPTHHGMFDIAQLNPIPDTILMAPSTPNEVNAMMDFALNFDEGPVFIRYPRGAASETKPFYHHKQIELGKSILLQEGKDILLVSYGNMLGLVAQVAKLLFAHGIKAGILDLRFAKPLDSDTLFKLSYDFKIFCTFEDACLIGGVGNSIAMILKESKVKMMHFGYQDAFLPHGTPNELKEWSGLETDSVFNSIWDEFSKIG